MRPYLAFFRAGPNSLHRKLLAEDTRRNWDCCVSWYCDPIAEDKAADFYVSGGDNKFEAFDAFLRETLASRPYRYYLVLDDDLDFAPGDISRLFALCEHHRTFLCQPALRWGSHLNHHVTLWNPACVLRRTSFVEVQAPCFSRAAAERLQETFGLSKSTWGMDYAWASLLAGQGRIAVIDAVRMDHTKPVDLGEGAFYRMLKRLGVDAWQEYGAIKRRYPPFGGLRTLPGGHVYASSLPAWLGRPLMRLLESAKTRAHRRLARRAARSEASWAPPVSPPSAW